MTKAKTPKKKPAKKTKRVKVAADGRVLPLTRQYTPDLDREKFNEIIIKISAGSWMTRACQDVGVPEQHFYQWLWADEDGKPEYQGLANEYARAVKRRTDALAEANHQVAFQAASSTYTDINGQTRVDSGAVQAARLIIDTNKFQMAIGNSSKYGKRGILLADQELLVRNSPDADDGE